MFLEKTHSFANTVHIAMCLHVLCDTLVSLAGAIASERALVRATNTLVWRPVFIKFVTRLSFGVSNSGQLEHSFAPSTYI